MILRGSAGTGKTTLAGAIVKALVEMKQKLVLMAPTGRAAKVFAMNAGLAAFTIHRKIYRQKTMTDMASPFTLNANLATDTLFIVDEASMIDALLFDSLLKALRLSCRIILVGDSDQLPAVGAGNVLNDILSSDIFPSIRLKKVFRQAGKSRIITNAHAIINGESPDFSSKESDCFFLRRQDRYSVSRTVLELVSERLPAAYGFDPISDIQVLCPSRMMETGTVNLNNILQSALNPNTSGRTQLAFKGIYLREGDKVMQIKNNYDL